MWRKISSGMYPVHTNAIIGRPCSYGGRTMDQIVMTGKAKTSGSQNSQAKPRLRRPQRWSISRIMIAPTELHCTRKSRRSARSEAIIPGYAPACSRMPATNSQAMP